MRACGTISGSARAHRLRAHSHGVEQTQIKRGSDVTWTPATVTRNDALNLDGSARLVHISVRDEQDSTALYRKDSSGSKGPARWLDSYTMAGQGVMLKLPGCSGPARMHSIASTPYESRRDSSLLSASLIEVVAERGASEEDAVLAELPPGSELEVSQVTGRGFTSLLGPPDALQQALELGRPLLCIAVGTQGMVPVRALLSWTPVLAHATNCRVTCLYATHTPTSAVFLPEWDVWREAGIRFQPLYSEGWDVDAAVRPNSDGSQHAKVAELLDKALFLREGGLQSLTVKMSDVIVLLGFPPGMGELASLVTKRLSSKGVDHDRILYANL